MFNWDLLSLFAYSKLSETKSHKYDITQGGIWFLSYSSTKLVERVDFEAQTDIGAIERGKDNSEIL